MGFGQTQNQRDDDWDDWTSTPNSYEIQDSSLLLSFTLYLYLSFNHAISTPLSLAQNRTASLHDSQDGFGK